MVSYSDCGISRQCCNHPYVIDPSLQTLLVKGLEEIEYLNVGVKASGKLQLLDSMLKELKKNDLRALVLFQVCILQTIFLYFIELLYICVSERVKVSLVRVRKVSLFNFSFKIG